MSVTPYRRDIRFPPEVNASLERLKKELEARRGRPLSMSCLVVEIVSQFLNSAEESVLRAGIGRALRKEEDHAARPVRSKQVEGAEGR
jgi:hypothetical protein